MSASILAILLGTPQDKAAAEDPITDAGKVDDMDADDDAKSSEGNRNEGVAQDKEAKASPLHTLLRVACNETHEHATPAQRSAGNYKKGRFPWKGLEIAIENPKDSVRSGKDKSGKAWQTVLTHSYGYFVKVGSRAAQRGADDDHVDVFVGPHLESDKVFVVDQTDPDNGDFDEVKVMVGFNTEKEAREGYLSNYSKGWLGLGLMTDTTVEELKTWLKSGDTKKPFGMKGKKASALDQLLQAKDHSDAKRYTSKHAILRKLLGEVPKDFFVDSDDKTSHPGLTHKPTGFQIHAPRTVAVLAKGEKEKQAVVEQDETTGKWILWTKDRKRKLGTHDKPEDAYKQEYAIQKSVEKQAEGYREGGEFTHEGKRYDLDTVLANSEGQPVKQYPVGALQWLLEHTEPDPKRVAAADPATPGLVSETADGKPTVVDGLHRLKKLVDEGGTHFLGRDAVIDKQAAAPSKGCLMLQLPSGITDRIQAWSKANIPNDELAGDGRETESHVTALYGFSNETSIKDLDLNIRPIEMKFGKIKRFKADDNRPDSDVLVIEVISTELKGLNARLKKEHDVTSTYKGFSPHCTIAYVKPGSLPKLDGLDTFDGATFNSNTLLYSRTVDGKREKKTMNLKEKAAQEQIKVAAFERAKAQAMLDFHTKWASDSGFGGGLPQIPQAPSLKPPGAWERAGGLEGIAGSATTPIRDAATGIANTWNNWGGLQGIGKNVGQFAGQMGSRTAWATGLVGSAANSGANMWSNKDRTWNTLMTGKPGSTPEKTLLKPIEEASMDDTPLPGEGEGGFMDSLWKSPLMPTSLVRGFTNTVGNARINFENAFSGGKDGFGERGVAGQSYRADGTPIQ